MPENSDAKKLWTLFVGDIGSIRSIEPLRMDFSHNPQENYILLVRIDPISLPGMPADTTYLESSLGPERIAQLFERRCGALLASNPDDV